MAVDHQWRQTHAVEALPANLAHPRVLCQRNAMFLALRACEGPNARARERRAYRRAVSRTEPIVLAARTASGARSDGRRRESR